MADNMLHVGAGLFTCELPPRGCGRSLPLSEFGNLDVDHLCRDCRRRESKELEARRTWSKAQAKANEVMKVVVRHGAGAPHVDDMLASIMSEFGGIEKFCHEWWCQIDKNVQRNPGSATAIKQFTDIARFIASATTRRDKATDVRLLKDSELQEEVASFMLAYVKDKESTVDGQLLTSNEVAPAPLPEPDPVGSGQ
jgi:hypothetical protein